MPIQHISVVKLRRTTVCMIDDVFEKLVPCDSMQRRIRPPYYSTDSRLPMYMSTPNEGGVKR